MLTVADFPPTDDIQSLQNAIAIAQSLAEGSSGANRSLTPTQYVETVNIERTGMGYLAYMPILTTPTPSIQIRGFVNDGWQRNTTFSDWTALSAENYRLDFDTGEVYLDDANFNFGNLHNLRRNPLYMSPKLQLKVIYTSGFDFSVASPIVQSIKNSFIALTNLINANTTIAGVKSFKIDDKGHETVYQSAADTQIFGASITGATTLANLLLEDFRKYRPRSYSFA